MLYTPLELQAFAAAVYGGRDVLLTPYVYTLDFPALAQNIPQTRQLQLTATADFIATGLFVSANDSSGNYQLPLGTILIVDTSSGERFTDVAVPLNCYGYDSNVNNQDFSIHQLPYPRFIQGRGSLSITLVQTDSSDNLAVQLQMHGVLCRARG
jgi:hypothetical protein